MKHYWASSSREQGLRRYRKEIWEHLKKTPVFGMIWENLTSLYGALPMPKQPAFPGLRDAMKKKQTRRELLLAAMHAVKPSGRLLGLIVPHYPKSGPKGRLPMPLEASGTSRRQVRWVRRPLSKTMLPKPPHFFCFGLIWCSAKDSAGFGRSTHTSYRALSVAGDWMT